MRNIWAVLVFGFFFVVGLPLATADTSLLEELPAGGDTVVLIDFGELRQSPLYEEFFTLVEQERQIKNILSYLEDELDLDARNDIAALAMITDTPPLSASMLRQPMDTLSGNTAVDSDGTLIVIRGSFEPTALLSSLAEDSENEVDEGRLAFAGGEFRALDGQTMAIIAGNDDYVAQKQSELAGEPTGPGDEFTRGIARLGADQGIYAMVRPTIEDDVELQAEPSFTAFSVDLGDQVNLALLLDLPSAAEAEEMATEVDALRQQFAQNQLVTMFGARPLIENLSLQQSEAEFSLRTSMTNEQTQRLVRQVFALTQSSQGLSEPIDGSRFNDDEDSNSSESQKDGVEADFN